jgi:flagellar hook-length control protein FliK
VAQRAVKEATSSVAEGVKDKSTLTAKDITAADKKVYQGAGNMASSKPSGEQAKGAGQFSQLASQETSNGQRTPQTQSPSALSQGREVSPSQVFRQIVQKAQIMVGSGLAEMKLELKPENLGKLHLKLEMQGGVLTAKFMAESQQVRELIESNLSQLRQSLADQGLSFGKIEVSVGSGGGEGGFARNEDVPYAYLETARGFAVEAPSEEASYDLAMADRVLSMDGATVNYLA